MTQIISYDNLGYDDSDSQQQRIATNSTCTSISRTNCLWCDL